jgi:hypothetical protein
VFHDLVGHRRTSASLTFLGIHRFQQQRDRTIIFANTSYLQSDSYDSNFESCKTKYKGLARRLLLPHITITEVQPQKLPMKIKYIAAVLIAIAGLGLQQAKADTFTYSISNPNSALSVFSGPYATVSVNRTSTTMATITFTSLTHAGNIYLFGDGSSVAVNVNATTWSVSGISGTNAGTGFTPGPITNGGSGNVDGFGVLNQTFNSFDGYTHSSDSISFTLTNTSGTWATASSVLVANSQGTIVGAHIFVTTSPANASNSALVTGFAANGGSTNVPDGGTTVMLFGAALGALGMARRFLMS